ncbi:YceI family protein [Acinetobacter terrestris]|uniref:YceI family protein n=1 Tax=Acinetobacter terrestris TaxID=2529843 RepID=UPI00103C6A21|nr:YceI family protein [Acinetobacter terrestris]TCB57003.1 YceI family protein [Acinetobacter terrestris]
MNIQTTLKSFFIATVINLNIVAHVNAHEWTLTPQTYVGFNVKSMGFSIVKGKFEQVQSSMNFDPAIPQNASAHFVMDVSSVSLNMPSLKNMMMGEDLFYVEKYRTATFKSHEFIALGNHHYSIKGDLTLRGVTQPVTLDTVLKPNTANPQLLDVESKAVVNRSDFGMKKAFGGIGEQVNIEVDGQWQKR